MSSSPSLDKLVEALTCLPGVGQKSAQRMALYLIDRNRSGAKKIAQNLNHALEHIKHCDLCRNFSDQTLCQICENSKRDSAQLCIVETPADVMAIETSESYRGRYFVLLGKLSPLDGIGPNELGLDLLQHRLQDEDVHEIKLNKCIYIVSSLLFV